MATATEKKIDALSGEVNTLTKKVIEWIGCFKTTQALVDRTAKESDDHVKRIVKLEVQMAVNNKTLGWADRFILVGINAAFALAIFFLKG